MATTSIKVGDDYRDLTDTVTLNGSAVDLTGVLSVTLLWHRAGDPVEEKTAAVNGTPTAGGVIYSLTAADVATPALVTYAWQVTFSDSTKLTFPSEGGHVLKIRPTL